MGTNKAEDRTKLEQLPHGKECTVFWFDEGGGLVYRVWDMYVLFEVPQYGGEPRYEGAFHKKQIDELLDLAYSWT